MMVHITPTASRREARRYRALLNETDRKVMHFCAAGTGHIRTGRRTGINTRFAYSSELGGVAYQPSFAAELVFLPTRVRP